MDLLFLLVLQKKRQVATCLYESVDAGAGRKELRRWPQQFGNGKNPEEPVPGLSDCQRLVPALA